MPESGESLQLQSGRYQPLFEMQNLAADLIALLGDKVVSITAEDLADAIISARSRPW